jgi:hypothetical protein
MATADSFPTLDGVYNITVTGESSLDCFYMMSSFNVSKPVYMDVINCLDRCDRNSTLCAGNWCGYVFVSKIPNKYQISF